MSFLMTPKTFCISKTTVIRQMFSTTSPTIRKSHLLNCTHNLRVDFSGLLIRHFHPQCSLLSLFKTLFKTQICHCNQVFIWMLWHFNPHTIRSRSASIGLKILQNFMFAPVFAKHRYSLSLVPHLFDYAGETWIFQRSLMAWSCCVRNVITLLVLNDVWGNATSIEKVRFFKSDYWVMVYYHSDILFK